MKKSEIHPEEIARALEKSQEKEEKVNSAVSQINNDSLVQSSFQMFIITIYQQNNEINAFTNSAFSVEEVNILFELCF